MKKERKEKQWKKKNWGGKLIFYRLWPLIYPSLDHEIHPYLYGVEEEHFVFTGVKS